MELSKWLILDWQRTNYYRRERSETGSEEKVSIRWMAPESIEYNIYTEATDVVNCLHKM